MIEETKSKVDAEEIEKLLSSGIPSPNSQVRIESKQAITPLDEHFICTICLNVAIDPKEC